MYIACTHLCVHVRTCIYTCTHAMYMYRSVSPTFILPFLFLLLHLYHTHSLSLSLSPLLPVASRIQAESNHYDPKMIAESRAEVEAELRNIVIESARAIANNQSPRQRTAPTQVIVNDNKQPHTPATAEREEREESSIDFGNGDKNEKKKKESRSRKTKGEAEEVKRYPGYQPWPSLQDCAAMSLSKTLLFTSTWLSVTAKKIK